MGVLQKYGKLFTAACLGLSLWTGQAGSSYAASSSPVLEKEWTQFYGDPANYNEYTNVAPTADGGSVILGYTTKRDGYLTKVYVVKTDKDGRVEWENEYFEDQYDTEAVYGYNIQQSKDGGYLISGAVKDDSGGKFVYRAYLLKLSASGQREWGQMYGKGVGNSINEVRETKDGGYIVTTSTYNVSDTAPANIIKVSANGTKEWEHYFRYNELEEFSDDQYFSNAIESEDGGYWAIGRTRLAQDARGYPLLVKYDAAGQVQFKRTKVTNDWGRSTFYEIEKAPEGDGYVLLNPDGLWKIDKQGQTVWNKKLADTTPELKDATFYELKPSSTGFLISGTNKVTKADVTLNINSKGAILDVVTQEIPELPSKSVRSVIPGGGLLVLSSSEGATHLVLSRYKSVSPNEGPGGGEISFYLDSDEYSITVDHTFDVNAMLKKPDGTTLPVTNDTRFTIEHPDIVSIDDQGNITGLAPGLTKITAEYQGHKAYATVLVVRPYLPN
ncbi:hypothetical protein [Paenibacillus sp. YPG26]|uniref:hypothetical protein n=1 Tax=Paenibacillus sp. YPG26 TaxID=2878915 RepID=UPI00203F6630|nr:hypothetical protein [Paenibacillus sp. YPG26]USB33271.1 hypothetical protein LDO05_18870 [Paenibacillus sp. YPG26]